MKNFVSVMYVGDLVGYGTWFIVAGIAALLYSSLVLIYRLKFHPLAKYPGPFLGRITDWYSVWYIWSGDRHLNFYQIHQKYGEFDRSLAIKGTFGFTGNPGNVVRYGPNRICINTNSGLREIHGFKANTQKSSDFYNVFAHFFHSDSTLTIVDSTMHGRKKRVLSQALSGSMVKAMEAHILKHVQIFCDCMQKQPDSSAGEVFTTGWSSAKNMSIWTSRLTFDIMGDVAFGRSFGMLKSDANRYILNVISDGVHGLNLVGHMPGLLKLRLDKILFRKLTDGTRQYEAFSKAQSDTRIKQGTAYKTRDVFASLLEAKDPETGEGFTLSELVSESSLLIVAGSDTMGTAIASCFFYLLHYPVTLTKLNAEVRSSFSSVDEIRVGPRVSSCHYLRAILDEAMRLSPGVGGILPREVLPGGLNVDGHYFPAGTILGTPHYAIHHNEAYYPDPFTFDPSRWIVNTDEPATLTSVELAQSAFCPFSIGPRGCIGKSMAYAEMMIILARVVWLYDIRLKDGSTLGEGDPALGKGRTRRNEFQLKDTFSSKKDGPLVEFRARRVSQS